MGRESRCDRILTQKSHVLYPCIRAIRVLSRGVMERESRCDRTEA
jgi:hypothetical protein